MIWVAVLVLVGFAVLGVSEPVYVYLAGPASSLKTTYADLVAKLTPEEKCKHLTDLTRRALYYGSPDLRHFVIALDEMDLKGSGLAIDLKILRMLFSKGWCEIEVTLGGKSQRRRVDGPVMVVQTTTATQFDEQDLSRHLLIELPDTPERASAILEQMGRQYAGIHDTANADQTAAVHRAIHRLLPEDLDVVVPFAPVIARRLPRERMTVLRAFRTLISLVKASSLLHNRHRERDDQGRILAIVDDYRLVHDAAGQFLVPPLASEYVPAPAAAWLALVLEALSRSALVKAEAGASAERASFLRLGRDEFARRWRRWDQDLTVDELVQLSARPRSSVQRYLAQLEDAGLIYRSRSGRKLVFRLATDDGEVPDCPRLPAPDDVEREHMGTWADDEKQATTDEEGR